MHSQEIQSLLENHQARTPGWVVTFLLPRGEHEYPFRLATQGNYQTVDPPGTEFIACSAGVGGEIGYPKTQPKMELYGAMLRFGKNLALDGAAFSYFIWGYSVHLRYTAKGQRQYTKQDYTVPPPAFVNQETNYRRWRARQLITGEKSHG